MNNDVNEMRMLMDSLAKIENESQSCVEEGFRDVINTIKNKVTSFVADKIADEKNTPPAQEPVIQRSIEQKMNDKVKNILTKFLSDCKDSGVLPTVKNAIAWIKKHPSVGDNDTIKHAFAGIGIDITSIINSRETSDFDPSPTKSKKNNETSDMRATRIIALMKSVKYTFKDEQDFKDVLIGFIDKNPNMKDNELVELTIDELGKNEIVVPEPKDTPKIEKTAVTSEVSQTKIDDKKGVKEDESLDVYDKNNIKIVKGQVVKIKGKKERNIFYAYGKVKKLLKTKDNVIMIRVEMMAEDIGAAEDELWDIPAWELLKDPDRLVVYDTDEDDMKESFYKNKLLMLSEYYYSGIAKHESKLLEGLYSIALAEANDIGNDELSKAELTGLFELLLYISVAKSKGFDYREVTPNFKNNKQRDDYINRIYNRLLDMVDDTNDELSYEEQKEKFEDLYIDTFKKVPTSASKNKVKDILKKIVDEKNNYAFGIAFLVTVSVIIKEQKNKSILTSYLDRLYNVVIDNSNKIKTDHNG